MLRVTALYLSHQQRNEVNEMAFTLIQGIELSKKAAAKGYVTRVEKGRIQFVVGKPDSNGVFQIEIEVTDWIDNYKEALSLIEQ